MNVHLWIRYSGKMGRKQEIMVGGIRGRDWRG
jgi:hypothetical protein